MAEEQTELGDTTLIERRSFAVHPSWWLAAAALVFLALWGWRELDIRRMRETVESDKAEIRQLSEQNDRLTQRIERMLTAVSHQSQTIVLSSSTIPGAAGKLFVDPKGGRAIVVLSDLPPNAASMRYQLWITPAKGEKPHSAGLFAIPRSGNATLTIDNVPAPADIKSLGVTLEARGGAEAPSGDYLLVGKP